MGGRAGAPCRRGDGDRGRVRRPGRRRRRRPRRAVGEGRSRSRRGRRRPLSDPGARRGPGADPAAATAGARLVAHVLRPARGGVPLRRRSRGRLLHVPRARDARRGHGRCRRHGPAGAGGAGDGPVRPRPWSRTARERAIPGAGGRTPARRPSELDAGPTPLRAERRRARGRGCGGRRRCVADRRRVGGGGRRGPRGGVRVVRDRQDRGLEPLAADARLVRAPAGDGAGRLVGGAGGRAARPGPGSARPTPCRGRRRVRSRSWSSPGHSCASRCATAPACPAGASVAARSTCAWRSRATSRSPPRPPSSWVAAPPDPALRLPTGGEAVPAFLTAAALVVAAITVWRTSVWMRRGSA